MDSPLAPTYVLARERFRRAAASAGADVTASVHPDRGLHGEELTVDVARLGPADATSALVLVSGTHGVEGYCGSALQQHYLEQVARAGSPEGARVVLVHALNPYGFSWVRRTNENNVDLNRNFIDWTEPLPTNPGYDEIAEFLVPPDAAADALESTAAALVEWVGRVGLEAAQQAISGGQYRWPTGLFYGGAGPEWTNTWLRTFLDRELGSVRRLVLVDLHTGLGPRGHGELITSYPLDSPSYARATACFGEVTSMVDGHSVSARLTGEWLNTLDELLPDAEVTAAALEFGTVDTLEVVLALRADAWLHAHSGPDGPFDLHGPLGDETRAQVRRAFAEDTTEWFDLVRERFDQVTTAGLAHLLKGGADGRTARGT